MGKVFKFSDFQDKWENVTTIETGEASLQVYVNADTGAFEFVLSNNECVRISVTTTTVEAVSLLQALNKAHEALSRPR